MLGLSDDIAADWLLDIWTMAPTPAKSKQLRKNSVEQLLKRNRIRRIDAETVLRTLRQPAIKVAEGVTEAATIHIRSLITHLRVVNRELHDATHKLDELCAGLDEAPPAAAEHDGEQRAAKTNFGVPMFSVLQKATRRASRARDARRPRVVVEPGMRRILLFGNRTSYQSSRVNLVGR